MNSLPAFFRSALRRRILLVAGSLAAIGIIIASTAAVLANMRERALATAESDLSRRSLTFAAQANLSLQTLSLIMTSVAEYVSHENITDADEFRRRLGTQDVHRKLKDWITGDPQISALGFFGTDAKLVNTSRTWPPPDVSVPVGAHRDAILAGTATGLFISAPYQNRISGLWSIAIVQPLIASDGKVIGHLTGVVRLSYFEEHWRAALDRSETDSSVSLVRLDGTILARYPSLNTIGKRFRSGISDRLKETPSVVTRKISPIDAKRRIEAARVLDKYPLFIVTTETEETALRDWVRIAQMAAAIAACCIIVVLMAAFGLWYWGEAQVRRQRMEAEKLELEKARLVAEADLRSSKESATQERRLHAAVENMTQGLVMFDADERLVVVNDRFIRMYGLSPEVMRPGRSFLEVLQHRADLGQLPLPPEQYRARVKAAMASDETVQQFVDIGDGREISVINRPIAGGGWVGTHEDVTIVRCHESALQDALRESQEIRLQLDAAINNMTQGLVMYDAEDRVVVVNARFLDIYNLPSNVKPGITFEEIIAYRARLGQVDDPDAFCAAIRAKRARGDFAHHQAGPEGRVISVVNRPMIGGGWVVTHEDITLLKTHEAALEKALEESRETQIRLDAALNTMSQGLIMCDAQSNVVVVNREYLNMHSLSPDDIKPGMSLKEMFKLRAASGSLPPPSYYSYSGDPDDYISHVMKKVGADRSFESIVPLADGRQISIVNRPMEQGGWVATLRDVTAELQNDRKIQEALERSRKAHIRLDAAINNMSQGLVMCDADARIVVVNDKYIEMYGLSPDVVKPGCTFRDLIAHRAATGQLTDEPEPYIESVLTRVGREKNFNMQAVTPAGREILIHNRPMPGGGWLSTHQDITDQKLAARQLEETRHFLDTVLENTPIAIAVKDAATLQLVLVNRAYEELLGKERANLIGKTVYDHYTPAQAKRITQADREKIGSALGRSRAENTLETLDGKRHEVATTSFVVRDIEGEPQFLIVAIEDITERKKSEARIAHMAHHDALTNLPNRALLFERLKDILGQMSADESMAVLYIDLDHFKRVNDTLGHMVGNELLKVVADRLRGSVGENDIVARLSGDEFLIARRGITTAAEAAAFARAVREAVSAPIILEGNQIFADISIGIAIAPEHGTDTPQLMKCADMALYAAKTDGRGTFRFFETAMSERMNERRALELDLRNALENDELELYYQPLVTLGTDEIGGFEALMRWHHPVRGLIPPAEFIPVAEETGLISAIGTWALRTACSEAATWPEKAKVAVNVSPVQFKNSNLALTVASVLNASGLSPQRLEIEITEAVLMDDSETTLQTLHQLHDLGVRIAMDDFGTGYSSLSYLRSFPFNKIKIDRSFIKDLDLRENEDSVAIVRSIANLAASLNIITTAEGVETLAQLDWVRALGCTEAQGFLFGRPKRSAELGEYFTPGTVKPGGSRSAA